MQRFNLPDGKYIEIEDNPSREYVIGLQNFLAEQYPDYYTPYKEEVDPTVVGRASEFTKGVAKGLAGGFIGGAEGLVNFFDSGNDSAIGDGLRGMQRYLNESLLPTEEGYEDLYTTKLGQGLGSFASFFVPGFGAAKVLNTTEKLRRLGNLRAKATELSEIQKIDKMIRAVQRGPTIASASLAVPLGISEQGDRIEQARQLGEEVSPFREFAAETAGGLIGLTELFAPDRLLRKITKSDGEVLDVAARIRSALGTGTVEAVQETMASIMQDAVARGLYSDEIPIGDSMFDDFTVGGGTGAIADLLVRGFTGRRPIANKYTLDLEKQAVEESGEKEIFEARKQDDEELQATGPSIMREEDLVEEYEETIEPEEKKELQVIEQLKLEEQTDGSVLVIGEDTGKIYSTHKVEVAAGFEIDAQGNPLLDEQGQRIQKFDFDPIATVNEAAQSAVEQEKKNRTKFVNDAIDNVLDIAGLKESGSIKSLGKRVLSPLFNVVDVRTLSVMDSRISEARQKQAKKLEKLNKQAERLKAKRLKDRREGKTRLTKSGQPDQRFKQLDIPGTLDSTEGALDISPLKQITADKQTDEQKSLVQLLQDRAEQVGLPRKNFYTYQEAKKILKPDDFNQLMMEKANIIFKYSEKEGAYLPTGRRNERTGDRIASGLNPRGASIQRYNFSPNKFQDTSRQAIYEALESRNLEAKINSKEFQYFAEQLTGEKNYNKMNKGQKMVLLSRIYSMPRLDVKTKLPLLTPRVYTAQQMNSFYELFGLARGQAITENDIKTFFDNQNIKKSQQNIRQFKEDLINSGRLKKVKGRTLGNSQFKTDEMSKASRKEGETVEDYKARISTVLSAEQIADLGMTEEQFNIPLLPAPITNESMPNLAKELQGRLNKLGLKDVALRITNFLSSSQNIRRDGNGKLVYIADPNRTDKMSLIDKEAVGMYDKALNTILLKLESIDPNNQLSEAELVDVLSGRIDHEAIHAMMQLDLITEDEFLNLVRYAKKALSQDIQDGMAKSYGLGQPGGITARGFEEELVAELFRYYRNDPKGVIGKPRSLIQRILNFLQEFLFSINASEFGSPTVLLERIASGEIGSRERGVKRNLRMTASNQSRLLQPAAELDELEEGGTQGRPTAQDILAGQDVDPQMREVLSEDEINRSAIFEELENTLVQKGDISSAEMRAIFKQFAPQSQKFLPIPSYKELKKKVAEAARMGYDHLWYTRWAQKVPLLIGDANMTEFSAVFGITSAQQTPEKNYQDTLNTMIIARKIDPIKSPKRFITALADKSVGMKNPTRLKQIQEFYKTGLFQNKDTGAKTAFYANQIFEASQGRFTPFTVNDIHMRRQFGMIDPNKPEKNQESPTAIEYQFQNDLMRLLSTEVYNVNGVRKKYQEPSEIQAMLWGLQRYEGGTNPTNEGSYASAEAAAQEQIAEIQEMQREGKFDTATPLTDRMINSPQNIAYQNVKGTYGSVTQRNYQEAIAELSPVIEVGIMPGTEIRGVWSESKSIPYRKKIEYFNTVFRSITEGNQLKFLKFLKIPHSITLNAGTYNGGYLTPGFNLSMPNASDATLRGVAQFLTDALYLDSTLITTPTAQGAKRQAAMLTKPNNEGFTIDEIKSIQERIQRGDPNGDIGEFVLQSSGNALTFTDKKQFNGEPYSKEMYQTYMTFLNDLFANSGYNINTYGQKAELVSYGPTRDDRTGTRGGIENLRDYTSTFNAPDIRRALLSNLYLPALRAFQGFQKELGVSVPTQGRSRNFAMPNSAFNPQLTTNKPTKDELADAEAVAFAKAEAQNYTAGAVPLINPNASGLAIRTALEVRNGLKPENILPEDPYMRGTGTIPPQYKNVVDKTGGKSKPQEKGGFFDALNSVTNAAESARSFINRFRQEIIDNRQMLLTGQKILAGDSSQVLELERRASTGAIQALRFIDNARGVLSAMMSHGPLTLKYGLTSTLKDSKLNLINIFAPIYQNSAEYGIDFESLTKAYFIARRGRRLVKEKIKVQQEDGTFTEERLIDIPLSDQEIQDGLQIGQEYKWIEKVFDDYQKFNEYTINYGVDTGILQEERSDNEFRVELNKVGFTDVAKSGNREALLKAVEIYNSRAKEGELIETRGTAQIWRENADHFPFYREMENQSLDMAAPRIGAGLLTGNPLSIELKGSKKDIDVPFLDAILRNQLAILTAGMKNDGLSKLARNFVVSGRGRFIRPDEVKGRIGKEVIPVHVEGVRRFLEVDAELGPYLEGLNNLGVTDDGFLLRALAVPASILRETVTRDPGFMMVNMFRDTLSAFVTSGANFIPVLDTVKGFASDMTDLERFGVLGGYDYSNDAMSISSFLKKQYRLQGLGKNGSYNPVDATVKLWDWLGQQTYKSDGATRKAVYLKVLQETGDVAEAAYQAKEIINFSRRGANPIFRIVTTAIPFMNARIQGLDVLYRSATGQYSAKEFDASIRQDPELQKRVIKGFVANGALLTLATALYYLMVGDTDEYKARRREERDNNWLIFTGKDLPPLKLPIPFEVGVMFKVIPERTMDVVSGRASVEETIESFSRATKDTLKFNPLSFQVLKPFMEAFVYNRSSFTGSPIVPPYMEQSIEEGQQYRETTNELAKIVGEAFNISPIKLEYMLNGYLGTLGGYGLSLVDSVLKGLTGRDFIRPRVDQLPLLKRFFGSPLGGGLQQQYYEMREESNKVIATMNKLVKEGRLDEYQAYANNNQGYLQTRQQVLRIDRGLKRIADQVKAVYRSEALDPEQKREALRSLEERRNALLQYIPDMRRQQETYLGLQ